MRRREFLRVPALAAGLAPVLAAHAGAPAAVAPRVGIALGSGGANGLAHLSMLEVLDELDIKPAMIAGSSIGAVMGALYAGGLSAADIRGIVDEVTVGEGESLLGEVARDGGLRWLDFIDIQLGRGGLLRGENFLAFLYEKIGVRTFEALQIPLQVLATDYWAREAVVLQDGDLLSAVRASMAIPGLFNPVERDGRVLVDGGMISPLPYEVLFDHCDVVVAIDVIGERSPANGRIPPLLDAAFAAVQILQEGIVMQQLRCQPPHIYIKARVVGVRTLDFFRADDVYRQAAPGRDELRERLVGLRGPGASRSSPEGSKAGTPAA